MSGERERVLLTVAEAAELMGIGVSKAYELVAQKVIPSVKLGPRCTRVPRAGLDDWARTLAAQAKGGGATS